MNYTNGIAQTSRAVNRIRSAKFEVASGANLSQTPSAGESLHDGKLTFDDAFIAVPQPRTQVVGARIIEKSTTPSSMPINMLLFAYLSQLQTKGTGLSLDSDLFDIDALLEFRTWKALPGGSQSIAVPEMPIVIPADAGIYTIDGILQADSTISGQQFTATTEIYIDLFVNYN